MDDETRQQFLDRLIREHALRVADEAERYKDKKMDGPPTPGYVAIKHLIGVPVVLKADAERQPGYVTCIVIRQAGTTYGVVWGDTREESCHYDFELEEIDGD